MHKNLSLLLLLTPLYSFAAEPPAPAVLSPVLTGAAREELYQEQGMNYASKLYLDNSGSPDDETRSKKTEALNYKIRDKGVRKLEAHLAKAKEPRIRQELLHRLSSLYEQQAEIITRRSDLKDKETPYKLALRNANRHLMALRNEFPKFAPDATIFGLAENHTKLKEDALAEKYYREVINTYPKSPVVADSLLSLGNLYFEKQLFIAARGFYERILTASEEKLFPYAHYKMAWCYFNENNFPSAVARLEASILESRRISQASAKKLGVEEEALSDLVLFFAEYGNPAEARTYFEKLVDRNKANELRFQLAKRLFDYGKHQLAKSTAKQLLDEHPQKEFVNKLYLILISVAERTKDRDLGLQTAQSLATWVKDEKLASNDTGRIESEEYMRLYSQKLHHEAETMKDKGVWGQARKSYEIYLSTFSDEADAPEVKFRYAVLLMNSKEQLKAYRAVTEALLKMDVKHPRYQDALKIRIQSVELASKDERKQIDDKDLLNAYDTYAKA
ncbi:MAG: tetratricopeptide repeat protein, partial [Proteobacteria bacterium]